MKMYFFLNYFLLLIFLFKPIYNENCKMKYHQFFLLPLEKEKTDESLNLKGLEKFNYILILKTEPRNYDNYHLVINVTFPININIDLSEEIMYNFTSLEKFCLSDLRSRKYINIVGKLSEYETENTILNRIWIKNEGIILDQEVHNNRNQNFYILNIVKKIDKEGKSFKKFLLMKKISADPNTQYFQIIYSSITKKNTDYENNYLCEVDPNDVNELSIGDELTILAGEERLRDYSSCEVYDANKKKYHLLNVKNLVCLIYKINEPDQKC